jgi:hypothetical protein
MNPNGPCFLHGSPKGMTRPQVADGGDGFQIWRAAARFDQHIATQRISKYSQICNSKGEIIFYAVCPKQVYYNWVMQSISRQRLGKHISAYRTMLRNAVTYQQ